MKWILIIVMTSSNVNNGQMSIAVDHIEFHSERACNELRDKVQHKPKSGGLIGAINGALNGPIIDARCESVDDSAAE